MAGNGPVRNHDHSMVDTPGPTVVTWRFQPQQEGFSP
jgi:hypothetical protein